MTRFAVLDPHSHHRAAALWLLALAVAATACDGTGLAAPTDPPAFARTASEPKGRIAFVSDRTGFHDIYVMDAATGAVTDITRNSADDFGPAWSPDGKRIAFVSTRDDANGDIYVMNADGAGVTRLTYNVGHADYTPAWSSDGKRIAYSRESPVTSRIEIVVMNADGTGQTVLTDQDDYDPAWSPNGKQIVFTSERTGLPDIWVMNADGTGQLDLTQNPGSSDTDPAWYGKRIAFTSDRDANQEIYTMNADGTGLINVTNNTEADVQPAWSANGKQIAFVSARIDPNGALYVMSADGSGLTRLTFALAGADRSPAWTR